MKEDLTAKDAKDNFMPLSSITKEMFRLSIPEAQPAGETQNSEQEENTPACSMFDEQTGIGGSGCGKIETDVCSISDETETGKKTKKISNFRTTLPDTQPQQQGDNRSDNGTGTIHEERILNIGGYGVGNRQQNDLHHHRPAAPCRKDMTEFMNRQHPAPAYSYKE